MGFEQIRVSLIDFWPKSERDASDGDRDVAEAAWASTFDRERALQRSDDDVSRVVQQIVRQAHDTPKEGVWMKFFLTVPIYVERQLDKYRMTVQAQDFQIEWMEGAFGRNGITQNELSGRYRTIPDRPYHAPEEIQDILNLAAAHTENPDSQRVLRDAVQQYEDLLEEEHQWYQHVLNAFPAEWRKRGHEHNPDYKRVREVLRGVLGTAFLTDMRIVLNLNAFEHVINQRLDPHAQKESRYVAKLMLQEALSNKVAPEALQGMVERNQWDSWSEELP